MSVPVSRGPEGAGALGHIHAGQPGTLLLVLAALPSYQPPLTCPTEDLTSPHLSGGRGTKLWRLTATEARVWGQDQRQLMPGGLRVWTGEGGRRGHGKEEQVADFQLLMCSCGAGGGVLWCWGVPPLPHF